VAGLGLLPVATRFHAEKVTAPVRVRLADGLPLLGAAGGLEAAGYEIHCGWVAPRGARPFGTIVRRGERAAGEPEGALAGVVAGTLVHGLFEEPRVRAALLDALGLASGGDAKDPYDTLADHFAGALDLALIDRLIAP
jgi:adenosylcobyric acid synthase